MKKVLSLVLVIAMVLSSMSFAFASTSFTDTADSNYEKAIDTLVGLGVITGYEDGTFRPEKTITRAEMAKILVIALGYGDLVAGSKSNFSDTQGHWADAYIGLAAGKGLVVGTGNGKFTPDATVTYDAALTMIVRGLGYTDTCNEIRGTWPSNFKVKAAELGITKNVTINATGADRGGVAKVLANALECTLVTVDTDGNVVNIVDTVDGVKSDRILLSRLADKKTITVIPEMLVKDSKKYIGDSIDMAPYMYQELQAYVIYSDEDSDEYDVVYVKKSNSVVVEGTINDILIGTKSLDDGDFEKVYNEGAADEYTVNDGNYAAAATAAGKVTLVVADANDKEYKVVVSDSTTAFYNGEEESIDIENFSKLLYNNSAAKVTAMVDDANGTGHSGNDNGKVDNGETVLSLVVAKATKGILVETAYAEGKTKIAGQDANITLPTDDSKVDLSNVTVTGAVDSLTDIAKDDVVIAYEALNYSDDDSYPVKLAVVRNSIKGTITKTNSSAKTVYIDGTSYKKSSITGAVAANTMEVKDEGTFYLDDAGKIFAVDTDTELEDYAVVIGASVGNVSTKFSSTDVDDYAELKLATQAGETLVYKIYTTFDDNKIDDVATLNNDNDLVTYDATKVGKELVVAASMVKGQLVKYSLDEDGYIDAIETVGTTEETIDTDDIDVMTVDSTVVFDATDDYNVVTVENLKDGKHDVAYFTSGSNKGKIAAIVSSNVESVNDGVYGTIRKLNYVTNASGSKVVEVTALVDGKEVTFLTGKTAKTSDFAYTTTSAAVRFEFNSSDVLLKTEAIVPTVGDDLNVIAYLNQTVTGLDSDGMKLNGAQKYFASDVAVYIYDQSDDDVTIGDVSDLLDSTDADFVSTSAYVIDKTDSTRIGIIVQVVK